MNIPTTPNFSIFIPGSPNETVATLKHCFLERKILSATNLPANIVAQDGIVYQTVYDSKLPSNGDFECIISFQSHTYGKFAVIRLAKEESCSRR